MGSLRAGFSFWLEVEGAGRIAPGFHLLFTLDCNCGELKTLLRNLRHGHIRSGDPHLLSQFGIDAAEDLAILLEEVSNVLSSLPDALAQEADFYGAMDGASKFVRGDAIAGIIITFVNILGGLYVGLSDKGTWT